MIRIGYGAASIILDYGAIVTIVSSSEEKIQSAKKRLGSDKVRGAVGDVREEAAFNDLLQSLGPFDHVIFCGVDKIIRGDIVDANLDDAKHLFGVKFWGAVVVGKGKINMTLELESELKILCAKSGCKVRHNQTRWLSHSHLWCSSIETRKRCRDWRSTQWCSAIAHAGIGK